MKRAKSINAFTVLDVLVIVATVVVLAGVVLPMISKGKSCHCQRATCVNDLKQIGIGFRLYANDGDPYPQFSPTNEAWQYFQTVGSEIGSPKVLICPEDRVRNPAIDFNDPPGPTSFANATNRNSSLSYFYGTEGTNDQPNLILAGDRSLSTNKTMLSGLALKNTDSNLAWTKDLHVEGGNVVLGDGSVQQFTTKKLLAQIALRSNTVQRFVLP